MKENKNKVVIMRITESKKNAMKEISKREHLTITEILEMSLINTFPEDFLKENKE